jgi:hypothetical protein
MGSEPSIMVTIISVIPFSPFPAKSPNLRQREIEVEIQFGKLAIYFFKVLFMETSHKKPIRSSARIDPIAGVSQKDVVSALAEKGRKSEKVSADEAKVFPLVPVTIVDCIVIGSQMGAAVREGIAKFPQAPTDLLAET